VVGEPIGDVWSGGEVERLVHGLGFTEGPTWLAGSRSLLFTDIPANRIYEWTRDEPLRSWVDNPHFAIGLTQDTAGQILACEQSTRRVTSRSTEGEQLGVLASGYGGYLLSAPNDIVVRSDGLVLFTDPPFGVRFDDRQVAFYQVGMEQERCHVFAVTDDPQAPRPVVAELYRPNGICLSPDESLVYVTDTSDRTHHIFVGDLDADGGVSHLRLFADFPAGVPDGIKTDVDGRLYASGLDGVYVYSPGGDLLGMIPCPEMVANCCFGEDGQTLFMTASSGLYATRVEVPGAVVGAPVPR
jgi:gluconolactonase